MPQQKVRISKNMLNHNALLIWSVNLNDLIGFMDFKRQKNMFGFYTAYKMDNNLAIRLPSIWAIQLSDIYLFFLL